MKAPERVVFAFAILSLARTSFGQFCQPRVEGSCDLTLSTSTGRLNSFSQAQFYSASCGPGAVYMQGTHAINSGGGTVSILQWGVSGGYYSGTRSAYWDYSVCYSARNNGDAYPAGYPPSPYTPPITGGPWTSTDQCAPPSPPPPNTTSDQCDPTLTGTCSPIVLDLRDGRYQFSSPDNGVRFDINADGKLEQVAWPQDPREVAFLFLDRNGNGVVDDGSELFGNASRLANGTVAENGFVALSELDTNGDGQISAADSRWKDLRLWFDTNRDGKAQHNEIVTLDDAGVTSLALSRSWTGRRDKYGNTFRWKANFTLVRSGAEVQRPYFDVYLVVTP